MDSNTQINSDSQTVQHMNYQLLSVSLELSHTVSTNNQRINGGLLYMERNSRFASFYTNTHVAYVCIT